MAGTNDYAEKLKKLQNNYGNKMDQVSANNQAAEQAISNNQAYVGANTGARAQQTTPAYNAPAYNAPTAPQAGTYNAPQYQQGSAVAQAQQTLQQIQGSKPQGYSSKYGPALENIMNEIQNPEKFNYEFNGDNLFKAYADLYTQKGKQASLDAQGQAAGLTGGYGNSYGQAVGTQQYQQYLLSLYDKGMDLRNAAYQQYQDDLGNKKDAYNMLANEEDRQYGMYRDTVGDWQRDDDTAYNRFNTERDFNYDKYLNDRNFGRDVYENDRDYGWKTYESDRNFGRDVYESDRDYGRNAYENDRDYNRLVGRDTRSDYENDRDYNRNVYENDRDFNWEQYVNNRNYNEDVRRDNRDFNEEKYRNDRDFNEEKYRNDRNYNEDVRRYDQDYARSVYENDRNFDEDVRRDNRDFNEEKYRADREYNRNVYENDRNYDRSVVESDREFDWNKEQFNRTDELNWAKLQQDQAQFDANLSEEQRQYNQKVAMSYVQSILANGQIPSAELLVAAGLSLEDAQKMIQVVTGGGGKGRDSGDKVGSTEGKNELSDGSNWNFQTVHESPNYINGQYQAIFHTSEDMKGNPSQQSENGIKKTKYSTLSGKEYDKKQWKELEEKPTKK